MGRAERYPYQETHRIRGFECDPNGKIRLANLWRYMQEVATNHLEHLGLNFDRLVSEGLVFLLTDVSVKIHRLPMRYDEVRICTCPAITKGTRMLREVVFLGQDDEVLCEFQTGWVPVDPSTHRLLRPSAFTHPLPQLEEYQPFCDITKVKVGQGNLEAGERLVRLSDLDRNWHLNNTVYLDIIADAIGEEYYQLNFSEIHLKYKNEGRFGDKMTLKSHNQQDTITVSGHFEDKVCFMACLYLQQNKKEKEIDNA